VNEDLVSVCFVDAQHGWILSGQGTLISTDNGGQSWQTASLGSGVFTSVYFSDQTNGCITGYQDSSFIMMTTDGGENWQLSDHEKGNLLNDACFHDADHGWVVGIRDNLNFNLYTEDGGLTWTPQMNIFVQEAELFSVSFRDGQSGTTCGAAGAFFKTNNAGVTGWSLDISIPSLGVDLYSVYNWGMFTGCAVGSSGTALYTTNWWSSYVETNTNTNSTLHGVSGDPLVNKLWAAGENGTIIFTPNYLLGWITQATGTTENLADIDMIDENLGWAVGNNGTILRFGVGTGIDKHNTQHSTLYTQIHPNPTGGISNFRLLIADFGKVSLKIYDLHGREMAVLVDGMMQAGEQNVRYDLSNLPSGIYLCVLVTEQGLASKKMVKL